MFLALSGDTSMAEAVANTCMGMGIVFLVLIFIMLIISLFAFIPKIQDAMANRGKKTQVDEAPQPKAASPAPVAASENLMNDAELVAVITAAIYAASGSATATCNDQLVVRSIRRAR